MLLLPLHDGVEPLPDLVHEACGKGVPVGLGQGPQHPRGHQLLEIVQDILHTSRPQAQPCTHLCWHQDSLRHSTNDWGADSNSKVKYTLSAVYHALATH